MKSVKFVLWSIVLAALVLGYGGWVWLFERIEVPPDKVLVRIHKWGKNLPEGELVAPDESYKGVMLDVWMTGRYFLNPLIWDTELKDLVSIGPDECGVVMRRYGKDIPKERLAAGDFLARDGEKGIAREVLMPGSHKDQSNTYAYTLQRVKAIQVKANEVGVKTLKVGKDPRELRDKVKLGAGLYVVPDGYRGIQQEVVRSGTYYLNPFVESILPVEVRSHKVEFDDIVFPSRDGFLLHPHVVVEYAAIPSEAAMMFARLSDEGTLHQLDSTVKETLQNEILQKVVLPHIRGYARLEGSNFDARDFILTHEGVAAKKQQNARESLQKALEEKVKPLCRDLGIELRAVTLARLDPPGELRELISQRQQAVVEQDKLKSDLGRFKSEQKLKAEEAMSQRAREVTQAETKLRQEQKLAEQKKEVEGQRLKQALENADLRLQAAKKEAEAVVSRGKAEAAVVMAQNDADVAGLRKAVQGFNGVQNFAQYHVLTKLAPALSEIFASDDSEFARLISTYLTPPKDGKAPAAVGGGGPADRPAIAPAPSRN